MKKFLLFVLVSLSCLAFSQTLSTELSSSNLLVGQTAQFKINITNLDNKSVQTSGQNEMMPFGFEVSEDSIGQDNDNYTRIVKFSIPKPGVYTIPEILVKVGDKILKTTPYKITVGTPALQNSAPVTANDQISDIKPNMKVKLGLADYWSLYKKEIIAVLAIIVLIILIYKLTKVTKKKKATPVVATNRTLKALEVLKKKGYIQKNDYRSFYVDLIDILRSFLADRYGIPARELLTEDLVEYLSSKRIIDEDTHKKMSGIFERGDLAKFAKVIPTAEDMTGDFDRTKSFVKKSLKDWQSENAERNE